jgi:ferredoxin
MGWCPATYHDGMDLEVEIDRDVCMGSGNCVYEAPGVFELDDDGVARVLDPAAAPEDKIVDAARKCPTGAITVRRADVTLA